MAAFCYLPVNKKNENGRIRRAVKYLNFVDKLGEGDISSMPKYMTSFKIAVGPILEFESEEIPVFRWRAAA
jgi:hypothetical protein